MGNQIVRPRYKVGVCEKVIHGILFGAPKCEADGATGLVPKQPCLGEEVCGGWMGGWGGEWVEGRLGLFVMLINTYTTSLY